MDGLKTMNNFVSIFADQQTGLFPMLKELNTNFQIEDVIAKLYDYYTHMSEEDKQLYAIQEIQSVEYCSSFSYIDLSGDAMGYRAVQALSNTQKSHNIANYAHNDQKPMATVQPRIQAAVPATTMCNTTDNIFDQATGYSANSNMRAVSWDTIPSGNPNSNTLVEQALMQASHPSQQVTLQPPTFVTTGQHEHVVARKSHKRDACGEIKMEVKEPTGLLQFPHYVTNSLQTEYAFKPSTIKREGITGKLLDDIQEYINWIDRTSVKNRGMLEWMHSETDGRPEQKPIKTDYRRFGDDLDTEHRRIYGEEEAKRRNLLERKYRMKKWKEVQGTKVELRYKALELKALVHATDEPDLKRVKMN